MIEISHRCAIGLDTAATYDRLWKLSCDTQTTDLRCSLRLAAAQALVWTAAATCRVVWADVRGDLQRQIGARTQWAFIRFVAGAAHLASVYCRSLWGWAVCHSIVLGINPVAEVAAAQAACWRAGSRKLPKKSALLAKQSTSYWSGAAGFIAVLIGSRALRAGKGAVMHYWSLLATGVQVVLIACTQQHPSISCVKPSKLKESRVQFSALGRLIWWGSAQERRLLTACACTVLSDGSSVLRDAYYMQMLDSGATKISMGTISCACG